MCFFVVHIGAWSTEQPHSEYSDRYHKSRAGSSRRELRALLRSSSKRSCSPEGGLLVPSIEVLERLETPLGEFRPKSMQPARPLPDQCNQRGGNGKPYCVPLRIYSRKVGPVYTAVRMHPAHFVVCSLAASKAACQRARAFPCSVLSFTL